jgi:hypothetical protein
MVEQRLVSKLVSSPKPPEAGAQRARLYTSLTAGHYNSRMQLTLDDTQKLFADGTCQPVLIGMLL